MLESRLLIERQQAVVHARKAAGSVRGLLFLLAIIAPLILVVFCLSKITS